MYQGLWIVFPLILTAYLGQFISNALMRDFANEIAYSEHVQEHDRTNGVNGDAIGHKTPAKTPTRNSTRTSRGKGESDVDSSGKEVS